MFDQPFEYRFINRHGSNASGMPTIWHNYSFRGKNRKRYIVIAEQFNFEVYAIKFYLQEHKFCEHKFSRVTNEYQCSRIVATLGKIMIEIHSKYPYASFVFVGSPSEGEKKKNTKRFRLYAKVIELLIAPILFEHRNSKNHSAYLLLNRSHNEPQLLTKIEEMFRPIFDFELSHP